MASFAAVAAIAAVAAASVISVQALSVRTEWASATYDPAAVRASTGFQYYTFKNRVDHFDFLNQDRYAQRYAVDNSAWKPGGPIFLFLSGEAPMEFFEFQEVSAVNWAHEFGATYISLEHRYYGESAPVANYSTNNMRYLSGRQALADAAEFLTWYNSTLENPGPWVVFGCSYSGSLSAWFRAKYPNLVIASIAPSGPVEAQLNFTGFLGQFTNSASPDCVMATRTAVQAIGQAMTTQSGINQLQQAFNMCTPLQPSDHYYFLRTLASTVGSADQMNNPPTWILNATCNYLTSPGDPITNFVNAYNFNSGQAPNTCNDFRESMWVTSLQNITVGPDNSDRIWWWQKCTEYGYFKPTYPNTSVFWAPLGVEHIWGYCAQAFGIPNMTPDIAATNAYYGAKNLKGSKILFTNGLLDPWHLLSITEPDATGDVQSVVYEAGHCAPMTAPSPVDPPSLVAARETVYKFLAQALAEA